VEELVSVVLVALLRHDFLSCERRSAVLQGRNFAAIVASLTFDLLGRSAILIDTDVWNGLGLFHSDRIRLVLVALRHWDGGEANLVVHFDHFYLVFRILRMRSAVLVVAILVLLCVIHCQAEDVYDALQAVENNPDLSLKTAEQDRDDSTANKSPEILRVVRQDFDVPALTVEYDIPFDDRSYRRR